MAKTQITQLLQSIRAGDEHAHDRLISLLYDELRRLATARMWGERQGHTLQPTALVNEAYLRLAGEPLRFENRRHFLGSAARAMRRILIEHARKRASKKRGGEAVHVTFNDLNVSADEADLDLLALDRALSSLEEFDQRLAQVVQLRYFVGLSIEETASAVGLSPATVKRDWTYARAWLYEHMMA